MLTVVRDACLGFALMSVFVSPVAAVQTLTGAHWCALTVFIVAGVFGSVLSWHVRRLFSGPWVRRGA